MKGACRPLSKLASPPSSFPELNPLQWPPTRPESAAPPASSTKVLLLARLRRSLAVRHRAPSCKPASSLTLLAVNTYVVYPENKSTENAVLIITDIFGHEFINVQL